MNRIFIGLFPPGEVVDELASLGWGLENARWQEPEKLHVTLEFLGEITENQTMDVMQVLAGLKWSPFEIEIKGLGHFPLRGNPGVLWAGVEPSEPLLSLQHTLKNKLRKLPGLALENRKYHPHITLARVRDVRDEDIARFYEAHPLFSLPPFKVEKISLVKSVLHEEGSRYEVVEEYP